MFLNIMLTDIKYICTYVFMLYIIYVLIIYFTYETVTFVRNLIASPKVT